MQFLIQSSDSSYLALDFQEGCKLLWYFSPSHYKFCWHNQCGVWFGRSSEYVVFCSYFKLYFVVLCQVLQPAPGFGCFRQEWRWLKNRSSTRRWHRFFFLFHSWGPEWGPESSLGEPPALWASRISPCPDTRKEPKTSQSLPFLKNTELSESHLLFMMFFWTKRSKQEKQHFFPIKDFW